MLKLIKNFLVIVVVMITSTISLYASQKLNEFHKIVSLGELQFSTQETNEGYKQKTADLVTKIESDTIGYKEYFVQLVGNTSCGGRYEEYASHVEDALMEAGISSQKVKIRYYRAKNVTGDCALGRVVKVKLYLGTLINNDIDNDGVVNTLDECPHTPKNSIVSEDGCVHKTSVILLSGRKKHTAIVLQTATDTLVIDKPFEMVTLNSNKTISKPKKIDKKELNQLMGAVIVSSNVKQYRYIFYFTGIKLEEKSKKRVKDMLQQLSVLKDAYINIVGNTDTVGSVENNRLLGLKRAKIIADIIKSVHIKYLKMDVASHSELDLALPTKDETRALLNRRVEVLIQ